MDISSLTNFITAFRAETRQNSITPDTLGLLVLLVKINIGYDTCLVSNVLSVFDTLFELNKLNPMFHKSFRGHIHHVRMHIIHKDLLHLGNIDDTTGGQFLEFGIVYVSPVHSDDVSIVIIRGFQHKTIIGSGRGESDI